MGARAAWSLALGGACLLGGFLGGWLGWGLGLLALAGIAAAGRRRPEARTGSEARGGGADTFCAEMIEDLPVAIAVLDRNRRIALANRAMRVLLGRPDTPGAGADLAIWPQLEKAVRRVFDRGADQSFESASPADPCSRILSVEVRAIGGGAMVVAEDRSRILSLESHRRDFVTNVSHELKTPLAAILGLAEMLSEDEDLQADRRRDLANRILRQAGRLNQLVSDLLMLSKLDEMPAMLRAAEPCDLRPILREVLADLEEAAARRGVAFDVRAPEGAAIRAERELLRQVVSNLLDNAVQYAANRVIVRLAREGAFVRLEVEDDGPGVPKEHRERIFERFYRVDRGRSRERGGTGLGLSIVKNVVAGLGGRYGVRDAQQRGSVFWVAMPADRGPAC
ncbi:MAG: hypothetical protein Fur0037_26140 [Planctomycetota bacterium]